MSRSLIERRLIGVSQRLKLAREELAVLDEQLEVLTEQADDARVRALVSETPLASREHHDAERHRAAMEASRRRALEQVTELQASQDQLLDRLVIDSH
jgi:hypothetical protein